MKPNKVLEMQAQLCRAFGNGTRLEIVHILRDGSIDDQYRRLFATPYPCRPNPIDLSVARPLARQYNILDIRKMDMLD
jgi:tRNA (Thr-GGU) A37 N-methylase